MSKGLELSPKYGVNPMIPICFWCGEEKNEIVLAGRIREKNEKGNSRRGSDVEAPKKAVVDYEPCEHCKEQFSKGVQLIECTDFSPDGRPAISQDEGGNEVFPTGRSVVMKPEVTQEIFNIDKSMLEAGKKLCLDKGVFNQLFSTVDFI